MVELTRPCGGLVLIRHVFFMSMKGDTWRDFG